MDENLLNPELLAGKIVEDEEEFHHLNNPVMGLKPIVKKYLGSVNSVEQKGNKFYFSDGEARVEVIVVTDEIIRVRLAPHGVFLEEFSYAAPKLQPKPYVFSLHEDELEYRVS